MRIERIFRSRVIYTIGDLMKISYFKSHKGSKKTSELGADDIRGITKSQKKDFVYVIKVDGEILGSIVLKLDEAIKAFEKADDGYRDLDLVLDLNWSSLIDSAGLGVLASNLRNIRKNAGSLILVNISEQIQSLLEITKTADMLRPHDSEIGQMTRYEVHLSHS